MKKDLLLFFGILIGTAAFTQDHKGTVKGVVQETVDKLPLTGVTISVFTVKDSMHITSSVTSGNGFFHIYHLDSGTFKLIITHQDFQPITRYFTISSVNYLLDLGVIQMAKAYKTLAEVIITDNRPLRIKGDTLAYKTDAFKTKPHATAKDLLRKLPGLQVTRSGDIIAQGEQVQKVYVDGKEYFGNDPGLATNHLSADMIDQVEVFDDKSEIAKFSGIDDGSRTKVVNLKLKRNNKKKWYGKVYAGYGTDNMYNAGMSINHLKGPSHIAIVTSANNISNPDYPGADASDNINNESGLKKTTSGGINYTDTWDKNFDVSGSYFYNNTNARNYRITERQMFLNDAMLLSERLTDFNTRALSHRFNQKLIYSINSFNSLILSSGLSIHNPQINTADTISEHLQQELTAFKRSNNQTTNKNSGLDYNWKNNLIWRRKFRRPGRTFSASISALSNISRRNIYDFVKSQFYDKDELVFQERNINFRSANRTETTNYNAGLSYTEPLGRNKIIEVNYNFNTSDNLSEREARSFTEETQRYDGSFDTLTNTLHQETKYNRFGTNFRQVNKKYNYQFGMAVQQSILTAKNISKNTNIRQSYFNIIPSASFQYQIAGNKSIRILYRGQNNEPAIYQLQDIPDFTNYPYIRKGNPELRQEFRHNLMFNYNSFNTDNFRNFFVTIFYNYTQNKITNGIQLQDGVQIVTPVNLNGSYSITGTGNLSLPIQKMEGGMLSFNTRAGFSRMPGLINKEPNIVSNLMIEEEVNLNYNSKEKLYFTLNAGITYNRVDHSIQMEYNNSYFVHNYGMDINYTFPGNFILSVLLNYSRYSGRNSDRENDFILSNASLMKQFLRNKRGQLILSYNNILNQTKNLSTYIYENVIENIQNTTQGRYILLQFTYNLNH